MGIDQRTADKLAAAYTAAWNSGASDAVAAFYAQEGQIVINRGEPWVGRKGVADMAAGFFAEIPDLTLECDAVRESRRILLDVHGHTRDEREFSLRRRLGRMGSRFRRPDHGITWVV